jgi:hypothetical protein
VDIDEEEAGYFEQDAPPRAGIHLYCGRLPFQPRDEKWGEPGEPDESQE